MVYSKKKPERDGSVLAIMQLQAGNVLTGLKPFANRLHVETRSLEPFKAIVRKRLKQLWTIRKFLNQSID